MKLLQKIIAFVRRTILADCPKCHKYFYLKDGIHHNIKLNHINYRYICHRCHHAHKSQWN
jgi:hypothetical protein